MYGQRRINHHTRRSDYNWFGEDSPIVADVCSMTLPLTVQRPLFCSAKHLLSVFHAFSDLMFTSLHGMLTQSSDDNSVSPCVRPSLKRVVCDKTKE